MWWCHMEKDSSLKIYYVLISQQVHINKQTVVRLTPQTQPGCLCQHLIGHSIENKMVSMVKPLIQPNLPEMP